MTALQEAPGTCPGPEPVPAISYRDGMVVVQPAATHTIRAAIKMGQAISGMVTEQRIQEVRGAIYLSTELAVLALAGYSSLVRSAQTMHDARHEMLEGMYNRYGELQSAVLQVQPDGMPMKD